ncbi:dermonecrotic toxin domain-containing protein, partial [Pseudomonas gingeri]|uniref:dermonecrotic toxin domain-containing protein n=4 Tax=Pseudomonas TaxID=286 RepID=UPI0015A0576F
MSLTDMLLNNLSGLPRGGVIEVYHKQGNTRVPELEGDGVLHALFSTIDAGKNYPELLKRELLDEPTKKTERLSLFTQQVPTELKLSALELAIKGEAGFDTTGFRYIQEILKPGPGTRTVDGEEITIRPLAFER